MRCTLLSIRAAFADIPLRVNDAGKTEDDDDIQIRYSEIAVENLIARGQAAFRDELRDLVQAWQCTSDSMTG